MTSTFDKEFKEALAAIAHDHSLGGMLDMDSKKSVSYTCLNSFHIIVKSDFLPLGAYTFEQFFNMARLAV